MYTTGWNSMARSPCSIAQFIIYARALLTVLVRYNYIHRLTSEYVYICMYEFVAPVIAHVFARA